MTLTLTLDRVVLHTVVHHTSTSTYMPNFIEIKDISVHMHERTFKSALLGRHYRSVDLMQGQKLARFTRTMLKR